MLLIGHLIHFVRFRVRKTRLAGYVQIFGVMKFVLLILVFTLLVGCRGSQAVSSPSAKITDKDVLGAWNLKTVGGDTPAKINIKSWQVKFFADGNWSYSGTMTGQFEGMKIEGSGTYKIFGNEFQYTAGENSGKSLIEVKDNLLMLSPDPVVKPNGGKDDVRGEYERAK